MLSTPWILNMIDLNLSEFSQTFSHKQLVRVRQKMGVVQQPPTYPLQQKTPPVPPRFPSICFLFQFLSPAAQLLDVFHHPDPVKRQTDVTESSTSIRLSRWAILTKKSDYWQHKKWENWLVGRSKYYRFINLIHMWPNQPHFDVYSKQTMCLIGCIACYCRNSPHFSSTCQARKQFGVLWQRRP